MPDLLCVNSAEMCFEYFQLDQALHRLSQSGVVAGSHTTCMPTLSRVHLLGKDLALHPFTYHEINSRNRPMLTFVWILLDAT